MACIQYPTLATHLMLFHVFRLCRRVRFIAANAKNNIAVLQNLSAVSVRNNLDFFPADSDIPEEITVHPKGLLDIVGNHYVANLLWFFFLPDRGTGLFVLITRMKGSGGFCL